MHACARAALSPHRFSGLARASRLAITLGAAGALLAPALGRAQPIASSIDPKATTSPAKPDTGQPVAEPVPAEPAPAPSREPTAGDVAGAPVAGRESGRTDPIDDRDSAARWIGRGILFLPRLALETAFAPVRAGIWANERYRIYDRAYQLLFNDAETMGVYPTLGLESGFGFNFGVRFVHRDLFGEREHLALSAATGGRYRETVSASLRTGNRFGRLRLEGKGEYDLRPKEGFYGIGNSDEMPAGSLGAPIDALAADASTEARYRQKLMRARLVVDVRLVSDLHVRGAGALTDLEVARSDVGMPIDELYDPGSLVGWDGARHLYTELELRWDSRRAATTWEPRPLYATGWFAGVYGGPVHRLDGGTDFWRYGADAQRFLRIGRGPRVLAARAHVEAVSGTREEVPFFDLPQLGGKTLLRGYDTERFRDRIAAVGSLDYQWDLSQTFSASLFTDVGRVYAGADELALTGLRLGYGLGLEAHTRNSFWFRGSIASSIDGGVFLNLAFEPVFYVDERVEKR
jgi:hypothetical protein